MAADPGDRSLPDAAAERANDVAERARRRSGEAGRLRLRLLEIILVIALQSGLAASLSWVIAHEVLDRPAPIFAPSAAVGTLVAALGQRARRTAELMLGVGLGLLVSNLVLLAIGYGPWQIGVVVALAIAGALLMTGRSGALVAQAGGTAVLIATLSPVEEGLEWARIVDASVGAVVGLVVVALLLPINPMRIIHRAAAPIVETHGAQLREVSYAFAQRDPDRATRALDQLRGMDPDLNRLHEALAGAEEVTTISPVRWQRRHDVERYQHGVEHMDQVSAESRELARWAATMLRYDEPVPEQLCAAVERLADAIRLLAEEARKPGRFEQTRNAALDVARLTGQACTNGVEPYGEAAAIQLRTAASNALRAIGYDQDKADRMVREAANL